MIEDFRSILERRGFCVDTVPGITVETVDGEKSQATNVCGSRRGLWVCAAIVDDDRVVDAWALDGNGGTVDHRFWPEDFNIDAFIDDVEVALYKRYLNVRRECEALRHTLALEEP